MDWTDSLQTYLESQELWDACDPLSLQVAPAEVEPNDNRQSRTTRNNRHRAAEAYNSHFWKDITNFTLMVQNIPTLS